jgi:hypothetical protein
VMSLAVWLGWRHARTAPTMKSPGAPTLVGH